MTERVPLAVVGLGHLGRFHADNLARRIPGADLAGVCDVDAEVAREMGERLGVPWSADLDAILVDDEIKGVVVATATSGHAEVIEQATAAGRHVFTEKPIALGWDETHRSVRVAEDAGVILQVGFHRRFDDDFRRLADGILNGDLGRLHLLRLAHRDQFAPEPGTYLETAGHVVVDSMVHDFDTARWLIGDIATVFVQLASVVDPAFGESGDADHAVAVLRFVNGALGVIDNSRQAGYGYECSAEVLGRRATARIFQPQAGNLAWLSNGNGSTPFPRDHRERHTYAYVGELEAFAAAIRDGQPSPVPAQDGVAAFAVSQAALRSAREGRPVAVEADAARGRSYSTDAK